MATVDKAIQNRMNESHSRIMVSLKNNNVKVSTTTENQIKQELFLLVMMADRLLVANAQVNQEVNHVN